MEKKYLGNTDGTIRGRLYLMSGDGGMGGAGESKDHYLNRFSIAEGIDRGCGFQGYMSIDYALAQEYIPQQIKDKIKKEVGL
jgi:urocanate hydratase